MQEGPSRVVSRGAIDTGTGNAKTVMADADGLGPVPGIAAQQGFGGVVPVNVALSV
jgi:hypothetical protein